MSSLAPIRSPEDYHRLRQEVRIKTDLLWAKGIEENRPKPDLINEVAKLRAPYLQALSDPENPIAVGEGRAQILRDPSYRGARFLKANEAPQIQAMLREQTEALNKIFGKNWQPPAILLTRSLSSSKKNDIGHLIKAGDAIALDTGVTLSTLKGVLAHELVHRYQRTSSYFMASTRAGLAERHQLSKDQQTLIELRQQEAEADFFAAALISPASVSQNLTRLHETDNWVYLQYLHEQMGGRDYVRAWQKFNQLSQTERDEIVGGFHALPTEQRNHIRERAMKRETLYEFKQSHPSTENRLELQNYLKAHPELLTCRKVQFDGSAHITDSKNCGPGNVPMIVNGILLPSK